MTQGVRGVVGNSRNEVLVSDRFRLALAQADAVLGDIAGNVAAARAAHRAGSEAGADLVVTPEMFISGYQPQDLVLKPAFVADCMAAVEALAADCATGPALLVGAPWRAPDGRLHNAAHLLEGGAVRATIAKRALPNYAVFDEKRLYAPGGLGGPISVAGVRVGFAICEDAWESEVCETLAESGAEILVVPNGSPYARAKHDAERLPVMVARVVETGLPLAYLNYCGAQDDQVFDGGSFVLQPDGALAAQAPWFDPDFLVVDFERQADGCFRAQRHAALATPLCDIGQDYRAMVEGVRAYFRKNGFAQALIGLSGGVDSALVAAVASDALGPEAVRCVMLPSRFTSSESLEDAAETARRLGCRLDTLPIAEPVAAAEAALAPFFAGRARDLTEENLQSRMRGLLLMGLSNKTGALLLTTGNKSEVAVGYATLYGDMCGAYNPLRDLYKTRVFAACRWRNAAPAADWMRAPAGAVIPDRVIAKPPSAELRADQKDSDSLPDYAILDPILEGLIEEDLDARAVAAKGYDLDIVRRVEKLVYTSEYKRFQAAPGPRLTDKAFHLDRRYPITNCWRSR